MQQAVFFSRTFDETMTLMVEARSYLSAGEVIDRRAAGPIIGLRMSCEAMRVTSRLAQVMAWLMMQKAIHQGEITPEQAVRDECRLSGAEVCLDRSFCGDESLPRTLLSLMDRSHRLYVRVVRLEEMFVQRVLH
jgi:regulator of CtrA degradation